MSDNTQASSDAKAFIEAHGDGWQAALMPLLIEAVVCTDRQEALRWFRMAAILQQCHVARARSLTLRMTSDYR